MSDVSTLAIDVIRRDGGTQPRDQIDEGVAADYADALADGATFPPVTVFYDGATYWLADGFHRVAAHDQIGRSEIAADVRQGTQRDAVLFSVGANASHGHRRSNADKRRAVLTLLNDPEWAGWSDREIARRCAVGHQMVAPLREDFTGRATSDRTYTTKHGTTATMNTASIGKARAEGVDMEEAGGAAPLRRKGGYIAVPDGADLIDLCHRGIEIENNGGTSESAAAKLGLAIQSYRISRQIVMLADRPELSVADAATANEALNVLRTTLQYSKAWELAEPIATKVWGAATSGLKLTTLAERRLEQFERTFGIVMQSCLTTDEIDLPYLSAEQIRSAVREINRARRALAAFSTRIERLHQ